MNTLYPSDLSDGEWACVQRHLPPLSTRGRPRTHPLRRILDAIFYVVRSGCALTEATLRQLKAESLGAIFLFTAVDPSVVTPRVLCLAPIWATAFGAAPAPLLDL